MKILPSSTTLKRGPLAKPTDEKGVKLYYDQTGNLIPQIDAYKGINSQAVKDKAPDLDLQQAHALTRTLDNWFIIAGDNLLIIDTDSEEAEDFMRQAIEDAGAAPTYRVISDTNFSHYYYVPTDYYRASTLSHTNRRQLKKIKIDLLQGGAGAWGAGDNNYLKFAPKDMTLVDAQPIPDAIVDALSAEYNKEEVTLQHSDYSPFVHHIGVQLDEAFKEVNRLKDIFARINNTPPADELWEPFHDIAEYIIPNQFKKNMEYPWHPDTIDVEASSNAFVQASVSKLLRDNSIEHTVIEDLMVLITTEIWSRPITEAHCRSHMGNLTTQTFGEPPVTYSFDADLLKAPMISINGGAARTIYRNTKGEVLVEGAKGLMNLKTYKTFADTVRSKGYRVLPSLAMIKRGREPSDAFLRHVYTVAEADTITKPSGLQEADAGLTREYNVYVRTTLHNIILGVEAEPPATREDFPNVMRILRSITYDHAEYEGEQEQLIDNFIHLIAHKGKTFEYSNLVIQMNGRGGRGKGAIASLLRIMFGKMYKVDFRKTDMSNADRMNALWGESAEVPVNNLVQEKIKDESGDDKRRNRKLYSDATYEDNISTLLVSTNMPAIFIDERRFVLFSCFHAPDKLPPEVYIAAISELRRFCAYLRDLSLAGKDLTFLKDCTRWNGEVHKNTKAIVAETKENGLIYELFDAYNVAPTLTGIELHTRLQSILGDNYWFVLDKRKVALRVICYKPALTRYDQNCQHVMTAAEATEAGIAVMRNTTMSTCKKQGFNTSYSYVHIKLNNTQYEEFAPLEEGIKPLTTKEIL